MIDQDSQNIEKDFVPSLVQDQNNARMNILHVLWDDKNVNSAQRLSAVLTTGNWKLSLVTKGQSIKEAATKLQAANEALAKKQDQSAIDMAKQAYTLLTAGK